MSNGNTSRSNRGFAFFSRETIGQSIRIVFLFTGIEIVGHTVRGILFARLLGPSGYGAFTLGFFFIPLATVIVKLGIPSAYSRYFRRYETRGELLSFFVRSLLPMLIMGGIVTTLGALFLNDLSRLVFGDQVPPALMIACLLAVVPAALHEAIQNAFTGLRSLKLSSLTEFVHFLLFTTMGIAVLSVYGNPAGILFSYAITLWVVVIVSGSLLVFIMHHIEPNHRRSTQRGLYPRLFRFSIWFSMNSVVKTVFTFTDRWMLNRLLSVFEVGVYSVAVNVAAFIFTFGTVASRALLPNLSSLWEHGKRDEAMELLNSAVKVNMLFLVGIASGISLFRDPLIRIVYGPRFGGAIPILGLLLTFKVYAALFTTIGGYAQLVEKTYVAFLCNTVGLIGNVVLNFILIPRFGLVGAAIATTSSFAFILIGAVIWYVRLGMVFSLPAGVSMLLPLILLLPPAWTLGILGVLLLITLTTDFFLSRDEKRRLLDQLHRLPVRISGATKST